MPLSELNPVHILIIEDNPGDVRLTREAFEETGMKFELHVAHDGEAGLQFLRSQEPYVTAPRPCMVLLDLNLPRVDGREVLRQIKSDPQLCTIPVIILTTSSDRRDVLYTYEFHANCYLRKPLDLEEFTRTIHALKDFWFNRVTLPQ